MLPKLPPKNKRRKKREKQINGGKKIMIRALYSAASGMSAQQLNVDNIANNLANANTNGFKMRRVQFQDLLYQNYVQPGRPPVRKPSCPVVCRSDWERVRLRTRSS